MTDTLTLAKTLLERASITPKDEGCQAILSKRLSNMGFDVQSIKINDVTNLWATRAGSGSSLCFAGHTDVVPVGDEQRWHTPPFTPTLKEGMLYARGAADMKGAIAAMVTACERFFKAHPQAGNLSFLITSDEEGLAEHGTKAVLAGLPKAALPRWCLVGEASSHKILGDRIKVGRRGSLSGKLTIEGKQGHIAYPHLANNPIHHAFNALSILTKTTWDDPPAPFDATSLQFSNIHAGTGANNVIPGTLEADFNFRFSPNVTAKALQDKVESLLNEQGVQFHIDWRLSGHPFLTSSESPFLRAVSDTIESTLGINPEHSVSGGTSDGRFFAQYGTDVVELGPCADTIHQINECVSVEALNQLSTVYEQLLIRLFC